MHIFRFGSSGLLTDSPNLEARRSWLLSAFAAALSVAGEEGVVQESGAVSGRGGSCWSGRFENSQGRAEVVLHGLARGGTAEPMVPQVSLEGGWTLLSDRLHAAMKRAAWRLDEAVPPGTDQ